MNISNFIFHFTVNFLNFLSCEAFLYSSFNVAFFTIIIHIFFFYYYYSYVNIILSDFLKPYDFNGFLLLLAIKEKTKPRLRGESGYF